MFIAIIIKEEKVFLILLHLLLFNVYFCSLATEPEGVYSALSKTHRETEKQPIPNQHKDKNPKTTHTKINLEPKKKHQVYLAKMN